jgi:hypothetical protein
VWPGDSLRAFVAVTATGADGRADTLDVVLHNQLGVAVFTGHAAAR